MKNAFFLILVILLVSAGFLFGYTPVQRVDGLLPTYGAERPAVPDNPPPTDSICLVFSGVDYGGNFSSPQNYVNAKHIANVIVGSYYFPVVIWETGASWSGASLFSYWDDMFKFWSYPDSFTTNQGQDTGRPAVCSDSHGNLHFAWHQTGSPDGYETFYTRAILDTSSGVIQYNVERPGQFISSTNGEPQTFPAMAIYQDTLIMVVDNHGDIGSEHAISYNYSTDGGTTWAGDADAYDHGSVMTGSWILPSVAADPTSGDMWAVVNFDVDGDGSMDIFSLHWDAATNTWTTETVAAATSMHPYACCNVVVDYNGVPHVMFQENLTTTGGASGLSGWNQCGPAGTLYYTHRQGGSWSTPQKIVMTSCVQRSYEAGYPSMGIASDNTIYFSTTLPESASVDTGAYAPFNINYAELSPYTGAVSFGGKVSNLPANDTVNAIYAHITYNVPLGGEVPGGSEGPGITWCQMTNAAPPADVYYNHSDTLVGIAENEKVTDNLPVKLYQNYPNPVSGKTMIRFTIPKNTLISLNVYDISGRLVKTLAKGIPGGTSYFVIWDGTDMNGNAVPGGVYLYSLKAGSFTQTRKLLFIH